MDVVVAGARNPMPRNTELVTEYNSKLQPLVRKGRSADAVQGTCARWGSATRIDTAERGMNEVISRVPAVAADVTQRRRIRQQV